MNARTITIAIILGMLLLSAFGGTAIATDVAKAAPAGPVTLVAAR